MEDMTADAQKDGQGREDSLHSLSNNGELSGENGLDCSESKLKRLVRRVNSQHTLILKVKQLRRSKSLVKDSFFQGIRVIDGCIPKHLVDVDEKYLRRCLEHIHISASKASSCSISLNLDWENLNPEGLNPAKFGSECTSNVARLDFYCPLAAGTGSVIVRPAERLIVGSIMSSKSMVNILKSPLLRQNGAFDSDTNFRNVNSNDFKGSNSISHDFMNSPGGLSSYSPHKVDKDAPIPGNHGYGSETFHERLFSMSSTNSTYSDPSSSSHSASAIQGMLQCRWKGGKPYFIFSLDDQKAVYVANLWKVESADNKAPDYVYLFHSRIGGQKEREIPDNESDLVGKLKVSTSITLCPDSSRIVEREFVLFGVNDNAVGEMQMSRHGLRKNKGLSKKVAEVFRTTHSIKKRSRSKFGGSSAKLENFSWEPFQDTDIDAVGGVNLLGSYIPPNFELAAIVVKDHICDNSQEKLGGWGLKFLKKAGLKRTSDIMESLVPSDCARDSGDCSRSVDVLVPAGLHGGPRTRNGGPSSLIERWRSGGCCDCGGWDLGCPLTVLKGESSNRELSSQADMQAECKLIDLFIQGSENGAPPWRMVNVYDGLYFVHFRTTLTALQSFSIAVAFIHSQSPAFHPKTYRN